MERLLVILMTLLSTVFASQLRINEVDTVGRFVEIYNPGGFAITDSIEVKAFLKVDLAANDWFSSSTQSIQGQNGEYIVIQYSNPFPTTKVIMIALTNNDVYFDTFGFILPGFTSYQITGDYSEWSGKFKTFDQVYSRCDSLDANSPEAFQATDSSINSQNPCSIASGNGDPHFIQTLLDNRTSQPINICYDVSGQSGQSIFILKDNFLETTIEGVLLDDYYMHRINIDLKGISLIIGTKSIFFQNRVNKWSKNEILYFRDTRIECLSNNKIKIEVWSEKGNLIIIIKKSMNQFGIEHLDISFPDFKFVNENERRYGGLLGDVQRKNISIDSRVQGEGQLSIDADGKKIMGSLKRREGRECALVSFKELVGSSKVYKYVR